MCQNIHHGQYTSFKWSNNAKNKAGVTCVIIGLCSNNQVIEKKIYSESDCRIVKNITPYLTEGSDVIVAPRTTILSQGLNKMELGNYPLEGGYLKMTPQEKDEFLSEYPDCARFIRPLIGGEEFLNGIPRYCIWIYNEDYEIAIANPVLKERIEKVREFRINGGDVARTLVNRSHQFRYMKEATKQMIVVPCTSSERREYIPCAFFTAEYIAMHSCQCIYDQDLWALGLISSKMHMAWTKAVGGYLGTSIRYSVQLVYNTFPFPKLTAEKREAIEAATEEVVLIREDYPGKTLAELYDPDTMPADLRAAHATLDDLVESCYPGYPFATDEARLECLFKLYEKMTAKK